ncbi:MAG: energy transducer TonB [Mongoliitalea sp.]
MRKLFILSIAFLFFTFHAIAQEREIIPLNEHFYPLTLGFGEHTYNDVKTMSSEGEILEKIYTLDHRLVQNRKTTLGDNGVERIQVSKYGTDGDLISIEITEFEEGLTYTQVHNGSRVVLELACAGNFCEGEFNGSFVDRNVFKPSFRSVDSWERFIQSELTYPVVARRVGAQGIVLLGLKISSNGTLLEKVVMNPNEVHKSLAKEALRIIDLYEDGFIYAVDLQDYPIDAWLYLPVRFVLE